MLNPWLRYVDNISIAYLAVNSNEDFLFCRPIAVSVSTSLQQLWFGFFSGLGSFGGLVLVGFVCWFGFFVQKNLREWAGGINTGRRQYGMEFRTSKGKDKGKSILRTLLLPFSLAT